MIWFSADKSPVTKNGAEVDFVENINKSIADNTTEFYSNIHSWTRGSTVLHSLDRYSNVKQDATYKTSPSVSLADDYHVYGLQWTQDEYVFMLMVSNISGMISKTDTLAKTEIMLIHFINLCFLFSMLVWKHRVNTVSLGRKVIHQPQSVT